MFTGIVTQLGEVIDITQRNEGLCLRVRTRWDVSTIDIGASIAHDGVCLTVTRKSNGTDEHWFEVEAWEEALRLTTLGQWKPGYRVNLERALRVGDELGGHMVTGHVDGMAQIVEIQPEGDANRFFFEASRDHAKYIINKGSVTLNGTSLTVNYIDDCRFDVLIIDHTQKVTNWQFAKTGQHVNIEVDQMARFAERFMQANP